MGRRSMSTSLVPTGNVDDLAIQSHGTLERIRELRLALPTLSAVDLQAAVIWAQAVNAAGRAQRAWDVAREASDVQIRAERRLGQLLNAYLNDGRTATQKLDDVYNGNGRERIPVDWKREGALSRLGSIPDDIFEDVVNDLLDRRKSVAIPTVLRLAHRHSLTRVEDHIYVAWDGAYFLQPDMSLRRSHATTLDQARAELHEALRLKKRPPRLPIAKSLDDAFAEARRDAQSLSRLRETISGEPGRLISEAELLQSKVAEILFKAYRLVEVAK